MKKTLCITTPCHLQLRDGHLMYTHGESQEQKECPIEALAYLILEHTHITLSQALLVALAKAKVAVITCDERHLPNGLMLPLAGHYLHSERARCQWALTSEKKAGLWHQIVRAKIKNQAAVLQKTGLGTHTYLYKLLQHRDVPKSSAHEAQAASWYWSKLFGTHFRRRRYGLPPNAALNYGYAILRTAMARALASQGLILSIGITHHNRYNPFCLADDLMEPYRPFVDTYVWEVHQEKPYKKK